MSNVRNTFWARATLSTVGYVAARLASAHGRVLLAMNDC